MEKKIESLLAEIIRIKTELTELEKEAEDVKNRILWAKDGPDIFGHTPDYTYHEIAKVYENIYVANDNLLGSETLIHRLRGSENLARSLRD